MNSFAIAITSYLTEGDDLKEDFPRPRTGDGHDTWDLLAMSN